MYSNNGQQSSTSAGEYIPNPQHFQQHFWGVPTAEEGTTLETGQASLREGGKNAMVPLDNQQQTIFYQTIGGIGPMKRAFREDENVDEETMEKENEQPTAKRLHLAAAAESAEGGEEEDEEEEGEEENSRSTKSSSSAENEEPLAPSSCYSSSLCALPQQQCASSSVMATPHQRTYPALSAALGNPLAHSTPHLAGISLNSFQQQPPLDYWGGMALHQALVASHKNIAAGGAFMTNPSPLGQLTPSSSVYYSNPYGHPHQNFMAPYGAVGIAPNGAGGPFSQRTVKDFKHFEGGEFQLSFVPPFQQEYAPLLHNSPFNSTYQSRDSGVGSVKVESKGGTDFYGMASRMHVDVAEDGRNETKYSSSTSGGSDESGHTGSAIDRASVLVPSDNKFPPFWKMTAKGREDLETIIFVKVPPRLALLNCNKKYSISLAEIHRRVGRPEHLNTSYLSGILRKAKNQDAGKLLREKLNAFGTGIDLRTGRRKQSSVTTFTTLCEREAIQMADDFAKLASESFPTKQFAKEMNRRAAITAPEEVRQRLDDVENARQIVEEMVDILRQGIEQETLPNDASNEATIAEQSPDQTVLLHTTLSGIKNFARLSHCFGNRTVMVTWSTLISVFEKCKESLVETLNEVGEVAGTLSNHSQQLMFPKSEQQMGQQ